MNSTASTSFKRFNKQPRGVSGVCQVVAKPETPAINYPIIPRSHGYEADFLVTITTSDFTPHCLDLLRTLVTLLITVITVSPYRLDQSPRAFALGLRDWY